MLSGGFAVTQAESAEYERLGAKLSELEAEYARRRAEAEDLNQRAGDVRGDQGQAEAEYRRSRDGVRNAEDALTSYDHDTQRQRGDLPIYWNNADRTWELTGCQRYYADRDAISDFELAGLQSVCDNLEAGGECLRLIHASGSRARAAEASFLATSNVSASMVFEQAGNLAPVKAYDTTWQRTAAEAHKQEGEAQDQEKRVAKLEADTFYTDKVDTETAELEENQAENERLTAEADDAMALYRNARDIRMAGIAEEMRDIEERMRAMRES